MITEKRVVYQFDRSQYYREKIKHFKRWGFLNRSFWLFLKLSIPFSMKRLFNIKIENKNKVPPEGQGVVVAANHTSHLDSILIGIGIAPRMSFFMASKKALEENRFFRLLKYAGAFPVDQRPGHGESALELARYIVSQGLAVTIFPQGKRVMNSRKYMRGKTGIARVALPTKVPILPAYISGAREAMPPRALIPKFGRKIVIRFGDLIYPENYYHYHDFYKAARAMTDDVMSSIYELMQDVESERLISIEKNKPKYEYFWDI